jgi:hypothetical protein
VSFVSFASVASAQGVRDHTRPKTDRPTSVTESQASELTLTLTEASMRPIQVWIRTAGLVDPKDGTIGATIEPPESRLVRVGQRVRAFPPDSRSSMSQAKVAQVVPRGDRVQLKASLSGQARQGVTRYVLEIVAEYGEFLSVPNEAIIERAGRHVVYVQQQQGQYTPIEIQIGVQGELFTQVVEGLQPGDQVVTFGSFFIDADYKLKGW